MPTILIVDNNPVVIGIVQASVKADCRKATIMTANHGRKALKVIRTSEVKIDIMIVDVEMPVMNGISLVLKVRKEFPDIIVILMSGRGEPKNHKAHAFVPKPIAKKHLVGTIKKLRHGK